MSMTKRDMGDDYTPPPITPEDELRMLSELYSDPAMTHSKLVDILGSEIADAVMELTQDEQSKKVLLATAGWLLKIDRLARFDAENGTPRYTPSDVLKAAFGDNLVADRVLNRYYIAKLAAEKKAVGSPV